MLDSMRGKLKRCSKVAFAADWEFVFLPEFVEGYVVVRKGLQAHTLQERPSEGRRNKCAEPLRVEVREAFVFEGCHQLKFADVRRLGNYLDHGLDRFSRLPFLVRFGHFATSASISFQTIGD